MQKHVRKYEARPSKSCVAKIVTTDRQTHTHTNTHNDTRKSIQNEIRTKGLWETKRKYFNETKTVAEFSPDTLNEHYSAVSSEPTPPWNLEIPEDLQVNCSFSFQEVSECTIINSYKRVKSRNSWINGGTFESWVTGT